MTMHSKTIKFIWAEFSNTTCMMKMRILIKCMVILCSSIFSLCNQIHHCVLPFLIVGTHSFHQIGILDS